MVEATVKVITRVHLQEKSSRLVILTSQEDSLRKRPTLASMLTFPRENTERMPTDRLTKDLLRLIPTETVRSTERSFVRP